MHQSLIAPHRPVPSRRQWLAWSALATVTTVSAAGSGCALFIPPTLPRMDVLRFSGSCPGPAGPAPSLLVLLPGAYSRPPEFVEAGFVAALRSRQLAADLCIVDSHLGYYSDRSIVRRLREEIVQPARAQGYRQVWLVGISLGGFAALGYAVRHGADIDGVLALAPYLGPRRLMQEIAEAGGPLAWHGSAAAQPAADSDELDREIWHAFAAAALAPAPRSLRPVHLGYGREDRFAGAHRVFAGLLPADRVAATAGGHDWPAWRLLWDNWLDQGPLAAARAPACRAGERQVSAQ